MGKGVCLNGVISIPVGVARNERMEDLRTVQSSMEGMVWLWRKGYGRRGFTFTFKLQFSLGRKRMIEYHQVGVTFLQLFCSIIMVQREMAFWSVCRKSG